MPVPVGTKFRYRKYPSGKRVRLAILNGRVIETKSMHKAKVTKTQKRLNNKRRRIGIR